MPNRYHCNSLNPLCPHGNSFLATAYATQTTGMTNVSQRTVSPAATVTRSSAETAPRRSGFSLLKADQIVDLGSGDASGHVACSLSPGSPTSAVG